MSDSDRSSPGATILIIGDDDVMATDVQTGLVGAGYAVKRAGSADEALGTLGSTQADVILMSLMLPDTDGLILCSTLKAYSPAPIIILSARTGEVDRALALESGAVDVLTTPVDVDELLTQVRAVTRGQRSGARSQGSVA
jgi:two-component system KDP operon response regulator KdpE